MILIVRKTKAGNYFYEAPCERSPFNISKEKFNFQ